MAAFFTPSCSKDNDNPDNPANDIVETEPATLKPVTTNIGSNVGGYYEALPANYNKTTKKYPVMIYLHGSGQFGNGSSELDTVLNAGTPLLLKNKTFPPNFKVNGENFSFVVLMPQFKGSPSYTDVRTFVNYALTNYKVDSSRIYITGFSLGARLTAEFAVVDPSLPAAIVTMAGAYFYNMPATAQGIAQHNLPVWSFHNQQDISISADETKLFVNSINSYNTTVKAKMTIFPTSTAYLYHDCWTKVSDPSYKEEGMNMYEWMLSHKK